MSEALRGGPTFVAVAHHPELGLSSSVRAHLGHEREGLSLHILDLRAADRVRRSAGAHGHRRARRVSFGRAFRRRRHAGHSWFGSHLGRSDHAALRPDRRRTALGLKGHGAQSPPRRSRSGCAGRAVGELARPRVHGLARPTTSRAVSSGPSRRARHHLGLARGLSSRRAHRSVEGRPRACQGSVDRAGDGTEKPASCSPRATRARGSRWSS